MTRRDLALFFLLGLIVQLVVAHFQSLPGYMDADYYFGGGLQLVRGHGFTEPYLWNYLDDPVGLPHPSHAYWLPLASIIAAAGMWITGQHTFAAARIGFILLAALVPPLTATLAFRISPHRQSALLSGLLAGLPIFYAPYLSVTDNYGLYMVLGALYFLLLSQLRLLSSAQSRTKIFLTFGLISGLMNLARSDGLLWLGVSFIVAIFYSAEQRSLKNISLALALTCFGFLLVMAPWYARNQSVFGSLIAPGTSRALWLTDYRETFSWPAAILTPQHMLASGWPAMLSARWSALSRNLNAVLIAQCGIILFPLILAGGWRLRTNLPVRFGALVWIALLFIMSVMFPFAGPRGAYFHASAALTPLGWALAPIGLQVAVQAGQRRGWFSARAYQLFGSAMILFAVSATILVCANRFTPAWEREDGPYVAIENILSAENISADLVIMVRNAPGFNIVTGRPAIVIPYGGVAEVLAAAKAFSARYLILEDRPSLTELASLFDSPESNPAFRYIGESDGARIYEILP